ncbi:MAG: outer membrane lipoprotein carrier protein LolA [Acetobacteraceae bacterium]|nr:outer membrane lipoprotein carrier protein LolA [Acetobacteraceae bacterium]
MKRRALLATIPLLALPTLSHAAAPDPATLAALEAYLNAIRSLKARFYQVAPNGQVSQGTVWLSRPGRMRFQYDPPSPFLLVAGDGLLIFHDQKLGQTSNIPLSQTPLGILLADQVRLSGAVTVTSLQRLPGMIQLSLYRTSSPGDGTLTLYFDSNPLTLRQWTVVDAQRQQTRVTLENVETGVPVPDTLFEFIDRNFPNRGG